MSALYTPRLLSLAAQLAGFPLDDRLPLRAEARSRTCGSTIEIGFDVDPDGSITRIGMIVTACAIGQSSAAILANAAQGKKPQDIAAVLQGLEVWLAGEGNLPDWPDIDALAPALPHPGRHGALLLPWQAALKALSTAPLSSGAGSR